MPNRGLEESICTSETLAQLSAEAERFWYRLLVQVDDYGRYDGRLAVLRAHCFTLMQDRVSEADIARWLAELAQVGAIQYYTVAGKPYVEIVNWLAHNAPRATKSKWPGPPAPAATAGGAPQPATPVGPHVQASVDNCEHLQASADNCEHLQADASDCAQMSPYRTVLNTNRTEPNTTGDARTRANDPEQPPPVISPVAELAAPTITDVTPATAGRQIAARRQALNAQVGPELRIPLVNALLDLVGKRALAEIPNADGERILREAHEKAVTLYRLGYQSEAELLALEPLWAADWRGRNGGSLQQFVDFASEQQAGKGKVQHGARQPRAGNGNGGFGLRRAPDDQAAREPTAAELAAWGEFQRAQAARAG